MRVNLVLVSSLLLILTTSSGCFKFRSLMGEEGKVLPPLTFSGVPAAPEDQPPVVKTDQGFVAQPIPGVTPPGPDAYRYIEYVGQSD